MLMAPQMCQSAVCPVATDGGQEAQVAQGHQCTTWALIIPQGRGSVDTECTKCQSRGGHSRSQEPSILPPAHLGQPALTFFMFLGVGDSDLGVRDTVDLQSA